MAERGRPLFLARRTYRRRRLIDTARLLPLFGAVLFLVPILWETAGEGGATARLAERGLYLFAVWAGLVAAAAGLARALGPGPEAPDGRGAPDRPDGAD